MTDSVTLGILGKLDLAQIVELHNQVPGVRQVSRMGDLTTARKRLELALERAEMKLARTRGQAGVFRVVPVGAATHLAGSGSLQRRIRIHTENPRRRWSASWHRWELLRDGMTIEEYLQLAVGTGITRYKARIDIYWDVGRGYISLEE